MRPPPTVLSRRRDTASHPRRLENDAERTTTFTQTLFEVYQQYGHVGNCGKAYTQCRKCKKGLLNPFKHNGFYIGHELWNWSKSALHVPAVKWPAQTCVTNIGYWQRCYLQERPTGFFWKSSASTGIVYWTCLHFWCWVLQRGGLQEDIMDNNIILNET